MPEVVSDSKPPGQFYCPTCEKTFPAGDRCPTDGTRLVQIKAPIDPLIGRELDGRYKVIQKLGQGGMGAVYRGQQLGLGREVAIKVVSAHLVAETEVVKRFLREAKLASSLSHPNAVAVLDFNQTDDGLFYLVMELVSGSTLDKVFEADRFMKPERIIRIASQVCDALEGAHALSIVHRDLKPSNIMLLSRGRDLVKVLDFGLAKSLATDATTTTMTNAGALLGTPAFIPPELALGEPCDGRADQYSLGVVLFMLGTGKLPFMSESAHEMIAMHATEKAPPMTGVPAVLARVVDKMLSKRPSDRFATIAETREALEAALDSMRMHTPPAGTQQVFQSGPTIGQLVTLPTQITGEVARARAVTPSIAIDQTMAQIGTASQRPVERKRWVIPAVIGALAAVAVIVVIVMSGGNKPALVPPAQDQVAPVQTTVTPPPPPPVVVEKPAVVTPPPPPPVATDDVKPKKPTKPAVKPKTVARPPVVEDVKPPVVKPAPVGQGSGSGLPF